MRNFITLPEDVYWLLLQIKRDFSKIEPNQDTEWIVLLLTMRLTVFIITGYVTQSDLR